MKTSPVCFEIYTVMSTKVDWKNMKPISNKKWKETKIYDGFSLKSRLKLEIHAKDKWPYKTIF